MAVWFAPAIPWIVGGAGWGWRGYRGYQTLNKVRKGAKLAKQATKAAAASKGKTETCKDCDPACPVCGQKGGKPPHKPPDKPPDYVTAGTQTRPPISNEVPWLGTDGYPKHHKVGPSKATIYRTPSNGYTYIDRKHKGKGSHLEEFDKNGKWQRKVCPACGRTRPQRKGEDKTKDLDRDQM